MEKAPRSGKYISKNDGRILTICTIEGTRDYVDIEIEDDGAVDGGTWETREINELIGSGNFEWQENVPEDDEQEPFIRSPKIGRNESCPCGSGKKYKRCCGQST